MGALWYGRQEMSHSTSEGMAGDTKFPMGDDAPKSTRSEDRLGHATFAQRVANVILSVDATNGYVLGLHGAWGSGKSTTMNFIVECIREHNKQEKKTPLLHVDFRPWLITGHQDLIGAFLKVLSEGVPDGKSRRKAWLRKAAKVAKASGLTNAIATAATALGSPVAGVTAKKGVDALVSRFLKRPSLQAAHTEMTKQLGKMNKRILVTVDDIDRLETAEIKSVMQMVKSVGKLPNVVYLLCYDREIVWRALDEAAGRRGPSFAEKIVQQELELPVPQRSQLLRILDEEIEFVVGGTEQSERWDRIVGDGVHRWIRTPRDIVRIANSVKFAWSALEGEIDPQDLLAMEGLRLFDADAFNWVRENRSLIFGEDRFVLPADGIKEAVADRLKHAVPEHVRAEVLSLVAVLFPQLSEILLDAQELWPIEEHGDVVRRRGIGAEAGYDAYFGLHPSDDAVPLRELNWLVTTTEADEIQKALTRYLHDETNSVGSPMIGELLNELYLQFRGDDGAEPTQAMLDALFVVGEEIIAMDVRASSMFDVNPRASVHLVIGAMLDRWASGAGAHLIEAFRKTDSPAFLADTFVSRGREMGVFASRPSERNSRISEEDFEALGNILMEKIEEAERTGKLADAPFFFDIVRSWCHLRGADHPRRWLESGMASDAAFMVKVCRGLVSYSIGTRETEYDMREVPDEDLYDLARVNEAAEKHVEDEGLTQDERNLIAAVVAGSSRMLRSRAQGVD